MRPSIAIAEGPDSRCALGLLSPEDRIRAIRLLSKKHKRTLRKESWFQEHVRRASIENANRRLCSGRQFVVPAARRYDSEDVDRVLPPMRSARRKQINDDFWIRRSSRARIVQVPTETKRKPRRRALQPFACEDACKLFEKQSLSLGLFLVWMHVSLPILPTCPRKPALRISSRRFPSSKKSRRASVVSVDPTSVHLAEDVSVLDCGSCFAGFRRKCLLACVVYLSQQCPRLKHRLHRSRFFFCRSCILWITKS